MKWNEEWSFACFYKFWSILTFSCDIFSSFSWNKCGSYLPTSPFPRKSNQNNKSINFMSLVMNFVTVSMRVFTSGYHVPMYFYHADEGGKQAKQGKWQDCRDFCLALDAKVLQVSEQGCCQLGRDRIWSHAFGDRWRKMGQGRECCSWSC